MAIPNPALSSNISTLIFLMTPETGIIINGHDYTASAQREDVFDAGVGYDIGFVEFNWQLEATFRGRISSSATGSISAAAPGALLTLGNTLSLNGITAGGAYCTTVAGSHAEKQFRETTTSVLKKPGIS